MFSKDNSTSVNFMLTATLWLVIGVSLYTFHLSLNMLRFRQILWPNESFHTFVVLAY